MTEAVPAFAELGLAKPLLDALRDVGYEIPSPIQAQTIPFILTGRDVLGQAQTGTGKTAAFALPLLSQIDLKKTKPQVLVLTPTRELALQVAEAFQRYAAHLPGFHVLPIYGGQEYGSQLRQLKRGVHVVVGTPGRVMDHMRRKTLDLSSLSCMVLDEADEMLRMGFIDAVEWILEQTPAERQTTLFSATMPEAIRRIASRYLKNPEHITIKVKTATAETIQQRYWSVSGLHKLDALTRILETESFDAMLVFVRTKTATIELAEKLEARGHASAALNGDIAQNLRERTIKQLKDGKLDIIVATDVAARGLDVERISHVINYDIPYDTEAYIHRIGRTGRAGRSGQAILFVTPRERHLLRAIEKATRQSIESMELPSTEAVNDKRIARFKQRISDALAVDGLDFFQQLITQYQQEHDVPAINIAAALAKLLQGDAPLLLKPQPVSAKTDDKKTPPRNRKEPREDDRQGSQKQRSQPYASGREKIKTRQSGKPEQGMERFRIEIGHQHKVKPGNIVGAIANEAGLDSAYIGQIHIFDDHSTVDLPEGMPREVFRSLKKVWVCGQQLKMSHLEPKTKPAKSKIENVDKKKRK